MFRFFSYTRLLPSFIISSTLFLLLPAAPIKSNTTNIHLPGDTWRGLMRFLDAGRGAHVADLKRYFHRFGYLNTTSNDLFDDQFHSALILYQRNLGLPETGKLDPDTMRVIVSPRCGVQDDFQLMKKSKITRRYAYFYGHPRWISSPPAPMMLTYAFSPDHTIDYLSQSEIHATFERAFGRWSAVIPVNFTETGNYSSADIKIGWYRGDHGDGEAFDGVLGVLAHAFSPENGRLHMDAAERWAVDLGRERSKVAVDLESVATHEIGHVLGLAHSSVKEAIMYPSLSPRTKKVELRMDDVVGIQALYGPNPDNPYDSSLFSEYSSAAARPLNGKNIVLIVFIFINFHHPFFYKIAAY